MPSPRATPHPCRCCGYRTLAEPPPGTWQICPVCFWEDTGDDEEPWVRSNGVDLREAQRNFAELGACGPDWLGDVRAPEPHEARSPDWLTLEERAARDKQAALDAIEQAFGGLRRGEGMRVYEAELADDYGMEFPRTAARKHDAYQRWQDIPDAVIDEHYSVLSFFDPPAFRFHMAAYMTWSLGHFDTSSSNSSDFTIYALEPGAGDLSHWSLARFALFDDAQSAAVVRFLRFMAEHGREHADTSVARRALAWWRVRVEG